MSPHPRWNFDTINILCICLCTIYFYVYVLFTVHMFMYYLYTHVLCIRRVKLYLPPGMNFYSPEGVIITPTENAPNRVWKGKISNLPWRNLANTTLTKWSKLASPVINPANAMYTQYDTVRRVFCLCRSLPQKIKPLSYPRKTSNKPKLRDILLNIWPAHFKKCQWIKNKGRLRNCPRSFKTKETWLLNAMWYPRSLHRKRSLGEKWVECEWSL